MKLNILSESKRRIPRKKIARLVRLIEEEEDPPGSTVHIIFTGDHRLAALNRKYRNRVGPTDVLSFNFDDETGPDALLGEIYISTDSAQRNLKTFGGTIQSELLRLCCHGLLHLLGYDHTGEKDGAVMRRREEYYMGKLNRC
jgi:probable rRNA maturation factor